MLQDQGLQLGLGRGRRRGAGAGLSRLPGAINRGFYGVTRVILASPAGGPLGPPCHLSLSCVSPGSIASVSLNFPILKRETRIVPKVGGLDPGIWGNENVPVSTASDTVQAPYVELMLFCPGSPDPGFAPNFHPLGPLSA